MTQEEKTKAYDEALEQAKKELKTCSSLDCDAAKQIFRFFPELRESEDEITRKRLINLIRELASATLPIMTGGYFIDGQDKRYIAYLEKQKEEEEEYEFIPVKSTLEYKLGFVAGKESEKQKENPKSADSIPSDCVSDAKCEDRSPKHSDSDGIDIRDTPAYWRGWDDAMKQKEQKPVERHLDLTELLVPQRNIEQKPNSEFDPNSVKNKSYSIQMDQWSEDDEHRRKDAIYFLESARGHYADTSEIDKTINFLKSLRPSWKPSEWNKEDKNRHYYLCNLLRETWDKVDKGSCIDDAISWLEELPTRISLSFWRPSEEQMDALESAQLMYAHGFERRDIAGVLESLYNDLKGLM